ncbi:MAG: UDP-N-acetyl-alpha-D-muramoyl-L-alanyl-L-glutamate epimerase, partial [Thermoleophilaceae bacterium]|nr:UDP-N-acetyl-alpha-D-muramoyl-L-alanyl-L-glutamate epimerase [Thermoleophilaceae bacterium]
SCRKLRLSMEDWAGRRWRRLATGVAAPRRKLRTMRTPSAAEARRFDPARFETFRFTGRRFEDGTAVLEYALDDEVEFVERVHFPGASGAHSDALLELLHLVAGVSYYKVAAPPAIEAPGSPLLEALYTHGLAEFAYVNGIDLRPRFDDGTATPAPAAEPLELPRRTAVPIGGGKDSIVSLEALKRAGEPVVAFSVGNPDPIRRSVEVAGVEHLVVERELSPNLAELNAAGALNGHVPVTAVVSAIACFAAPLYGFDAIAMSNERSASEPSVVVDGREVNHQWSKGLAFERLLRDELAARAPGLDWFSFLRPWSELAIARAFARLDGYDDAFTSCNSVFRRDPARRGSGWCGDCPKCRFVFLVLAPWMEPERLVRVFGRNLLDEPDQVAGFAELVASGRKPLECVGEERESAAALRMLADSDAWGGTPVVRALADPGAPLDGLLDPSPDHLVPERLADAAL